MPLSATPQPIYERPLDELRNGSVDISTVATPRRYRFVDCQAFIEQQMLRIVEFEWMPVISYSAISYVWKGNPPRPGNPSSQGRGSFSVRGAEDGDPISIDVLHYACLSSTVRKTEEDAHYLGLPYLRKPDLHTETYIWLDRLCIMQTSKDDKTWQIRRMFELYRDCKQCIILPGGTQRLVPLDEETTWIHRAWTLQEILAPKVSFVLFPWELGEGKFASQIGTSQWDQEVHLVVPGECAMVAAGIVVVGNVDEELQFKPSVSESHESANRNCSPTLVPVRIFGPGGENVRALRAALYNYDGPHKHHAIWQCALARTSSRPVDMVLSIMGLFDVSLDPWMFKADDRIRATVALARAILRNGGTASWIGVSTRAAPCPQLSTFPEFPRTSVGGKAMLYASASDPVEAGTLLDGDSQELEPYEPVKGAMNDLGYVHFERRARFLEASSAPDADSVASVDGRWWRFRNVVDLASQPYPRTAAVVLGAFSDSFLQYTKLPLDSEDKPIMRQADNKTFKMMLVEEHAPGKFHAVSYFVFRDCNVWLRETEQWSSFSFDVGGPQPLWGSYYVSEATLEFLRNFSPSE